MTPSAGSIDQATATLPIAGVCARSNQPRQWRHRDFERSHPPCSGCSVMQMPARLPFAMIGMIDASVKYGCICMICSRRRFNSGTSEFSDKFRGGGSQQPPMGNHGIHMLNQIELNPAHSWEGYVTPLPRRLRCITEKTPDPSCSSPDSVNRHDDARHGPLRPGSRDSRQPPGGSRQHCIPRPRQNQAACKVAMKAELRISKKGGAIPFKR